MVKAYKNKIYWIWFSNFSVGPSENYDAQYDLNIDFLNVKISTLNLNVLGT